MRIAFIEKTKNEIIKEERVWLTEPDKKFVNPFERGNIVLNFLFVMCGPVAPSFIDFRERLPENHYELLKGRLAELRKKENRLYTYSDESLRPIPVHLFYDQLIQRLDGNDQPFLAELRVQYLSKTYLDK